jgi:2-polyprenyl-3-methyl-5-hydroxy-6-metoxy-1,4-benzoquinol methylase
VYRCVSCGSSPLREIRRFESLPRVTSDSKPFPAGGRLFACERCGLTQKAPDARWLREIDAIYRDYEMYHHSAGNDQPVFDPLSGRPRGRCEILAQRLLESGRLAPSGTVLDVGAGTGSMLAAFSAACPDWRLFALDLDDRKAAALKAIPRFERLFTVPPERLSERFDLLTLIHSLEHFPEPVAMLRTLRERIAPGGGLFVEVVNLEKSPFDLVIADHLCHFTPGTLVRMMAAGGYSTDAVSTEWVGKEISLLARTDTGAAPLRGGDAAQDTLARIERHVAWLEAMLADARERSRGREFGIFGTSVAATWLAGGLGDAVNFFVDEDPGRRGREHMGRPIVSPGEAPRGSLAYLAFAPETAAAIVKRIGGGAVALAVPPDLT